MRKLIDDNWSFCVADKTKFVFMDPVTKGTVKFGQKDRDLLYYFVGTRKVDPANNPLLALSLTTAPVTLDINIAHHGLLGPHPNMKTVMAMAAKHGWTFNGTVKPCGSCALANPRANAIPKRTTMTKAAKPGERLFLDMLGSYFDSLHQCKYWLKIVDDCMRHSWDCFLSCKSGIHVPFLLKLLDYYEQGHW